MTALQARALTWTVSLLRVNPAKHPHKFLPVRSGLSYDEALQFMAASTAQLNNRYWFYHMLPIR